jgi:parallel beta-helix repeat protein
MPRRLLVLSRLTVKFHFPRLPKTVVSKAMVLALVVAGFTALGSGQALASHVSCGDIITADTTLDSDLVNCPNNGIVIGADNITLDLNGHMIDGDGELIEDCAEICDNGVVNDGHSRVRIQGGSVREFAVGVFVGGASSNRLRHLAASRNMFVGLLVVESAATQVEQNSASDNGPTTNANGIVLFASHNNQIEQNTVSRNGHQGIFIGESDHNRIVRNLVADNLVAGIAMEADNQNEVSRNRVRKNGDNIIVVGDRNTITRNHVADAVGCPEDGEIGCGFGISLEGGSHNLVAGNYVARARHADIRLDAFEGATSGNVFRANVVRAAGVDGIAINVEHVGPVLNTLLERNIAIGAADDGIDVDSATTTLTRNIAVHNGDLGIEAVPGVTDGGGNHAAGNGNPAQCTNIDCR